VPQTFDLTPDPRVLPQYYESITLPMDLETLRHRVQTFFYHSVEEFAKVPHTQAPSSRRIGAPLKAIIALAFSSAGLDLVSRLVGCVPQDVTQMVRNAKRFNNPSSIAHHHAVVLGVRALRTPHVDSAKSCG
jgi:hypothetical protein